MTRFTESDGVLFTEESLNLVLLGSLHVKAPRQNTTLSELKADMARQAKVLGGNGVIEFRYSQRADSPLKNVFSFKWDTERLVGTGKVVLFEGDPRTEN